MDGPALDKLPKENSTLKNYRKPINMYLVNGFAINLEVEIY